MLIVASQCPQSGPDPCGCAAALKLDFDIWSTSQTLKRIRADTARWHDTVKRGAVERGRLQQRYEALAAQYDALVAQHSQTQARWSNFHSQLDRAHQQTLMDLEATRASHENTKSRPEAAELGSREHQANAELQEREATRCRRELAEQKLINQSLEAVLREKGVELAELGVAVAQHESLRAEYQSIARENEGLEKELADALDVANDMFEVSAGRVQAEPAELLGENRALRQELRDGKDALLKRGGDEKSEEDGLEEESGLNDVPCDVAEDGRGKKRKHEE
ncbi:uncharacterized protein B0I36DRAFT_254950 [Microdochium trichocladiopsis]|uniref:Uncharacterized protein n=1 Tax=Microdochium trichocladiopsis TaxID=1682393 RepID=A0A9P8XW16_9PEZI|nr:uncharacterized protein B0I36DRAFT_254950 [Microdochium trichocladiopsis]KAH7016131.1 hypothetical protein B0I36DRAFT_254950 [Microdochium trichocladiopsis]